MAGLSSAHPDVRRALARLTHELEQSVFAEGFPLPHPRELAARYQMSREAVEQAYRVLRERDVITAIGDTLFAGAPERILSPYYKREFPLSSLLGEFFSYRREHPDLPVHIAVYEFDADKAAGAHSHDFFEITYVRRGTGYHVHNGIRYPLNPGDCFVVLPGELHSYQSRHPFDICVIIFYPDLLRRLAKRVTCIPGFSYLFGLGPLRRRVTAFRDKLHLSPQQAKEFLDIVAMLAQELARKMPGYDAVAVAELVRLIAFMCRVVTVREKGGEKGSTALGAGPMETAMAYIEQNFGRPLTVEDIARFAFISVSRLHHLFSEKLGCSVMEYVTRVRLEQAKTLLKQTGVPVAKVALDCGFATPSHFCRVFAAQFGMSPRKYRNGGSKESS